MAQARLQNLEMSQAWRKVAAAAHLWPISPILTTSSRRGEGRGYPTGPAVRWSRFGEAEAPWALALRSYRLSCSKPELPSCLLRM